MILQENDIFLRPLEERDINNIYISWFADAGVTKFLKARNISAVDSLNYLKKGKETGLDYIFAICLSSSNLHIGNIKIGPIKRKEGISDLVTVIGGKNYWGKGIAAIAIKKAVDLGFKKGGLRKFSASINSLNIGSIKAYIKGGFIKKGVIPNYFYNDINNIISISNKNFCGM